MQAKLSASQDGFCAGISTETALREFVRRVDHLTCSKKALSAAIASRPNKKKKVFERNFECQIMDKKNANRSESVLNQNTIKVNSDGLKLMGE